MIPPFPIFDGLNATFNVTEDCNLRCRYCYELDKKPGDLPLDYAKRFIEILLDDPDPIGVVGKDDEWILQKGIILDFIGGDAFMRPKLLEDIVRYFIFASRVRDHKWADRWRCSISTNGTLFSEPGVRELCEEFRETFSVGISVDGCPEIHNLNRSNSMDAILRNWDWYMKYTKGNAMAKATLNKDSIPFLRKSLQYLHEDLGLKYIAMNFIFEDMGLTKDDLALFNDQMARCVLYVLDHRHDLWWGMLDRYQMCGHPMDRPNEGWCGAGAMPCLSINGKIYPCFRFMPHTMSSRELDFHVGDVWNGFDHKERFGLVRSQVRTKISKPECLECPVESSCAWCIGGAFAEKGEFYRQTNICETHKIQAKWADEYWRIYGNDR
jgi:uncharacterized protein